MLRIGTVERKCLVLRWRIGEVGLWRRVSVTVVRLRVHCVAPGVEEHRGAVLLRLRHCAVRVQRAVGVEVFKAIIIARAFRVR